MSKRWFVTGTDTEVGKTVASSALLQAANRAGYRSAGYKPVASGSEMTAEGLRNGDALALQANSGVALDYDEVNPYVFAEPTSPHIVSADEGRPIDAARLSDGLRRLEQRADWVLVEGAGGWFTPLSAEYTFADWVRQEQLPVILVVGIKLGCVSHALLTAQSIINDGLPLLGWVANRINPGLAHYAETITALQQRISAPLLGEIPYLPRAEQRELAHYLDISTLL
mgnify:CR=1 FL=1